jgi:hypothetical protein
MTTKSLDDVTAALEQAVKSLRRQPAPMKKRMPLESFVAQAIAEIAKAAKAEPDVAKRRLAALKRSVDEVIVQVAKIAAEDTESEGITVEVSTAFAPTRSAGDTPGDDLTTAEDQSSIEIALTSVGAASADTAFAEKLEKVGKVLEEMKEDLAGSAERPRGTRKRIRGQEEAAAESSTATAVDQDGWPIDLNNANFLDGDSAEATELAWGADPAEISAPKRR